jgi:AcrR family transcriptional regulator
MPRPKTFDERVALDAAIGEFADHGFEGTSAQMLSKAMGIGRQSMYDTYGDKWRLYLTALRHYTQASVGKQLADLKRPTRAIDGLRAHLSAFAEDAARAPSCLGLSATSEFGCLSLEVQEISRSAHIALSGALSERIRDGQAAGDIAADIDIEDATDFLIATLSSIKLAARGGAPETALRSVAAMALRALT